MAKRDISTESMIEIDDEWLGPKGRTALASLPIVSAMIPALERVHADLLTKQVASPPAAVAAKIAAIQQKQTAFDAKHDRKMRGTINLLGALADLADDPEDAKRYLELRDVLCPDGLKGIIKSYTDEAGAAKLLRGRLDEPTKKQLGKIAVPGGKLLDAVNDWMTSADELGTLEKDKTTLADQTAAPAGKKPQDALDARNAWIRFVAALETALDISGAEQATIDAILKPVRDADAKAEKKKGAAGRAAPEAEKKAPEAPEKKAPEEKAAPDGG